MTDPAAYETETFASEPPAAARTEAGATEAGATETAATETDTTDPGQIDDPAAESPGPESTGHSDVDQVVETLGSLDERPVGEHVEVFERAHEALRGTLADAGREAAAAAESDAERS